MLCVWVYGCDPGSVSDGSRLALYQTLSIECPPLTFSGMCFVLLFLSSFVFVLFRFHALVGTFFVDVPPMIFSCPADYVVPEWQPYYTIL